MTSRHAATRSPNARGAQAASRAALRLATLTAAVLILVPSVRCGPPAAGAAERQARPADAAAAPVSPAPLPPISTSTGRIRPDDDAKPAKPVPAPLPAEVPWICPAQPDPALALHLSPATPVAGRPLRLVVVSETELPALAAVLEGPAGRVRLDSAKAWGGPPWAWTASTPLPDGPSRLAVLGADPARPLACLDVVPAAAPGPEASAPEHGVWPVERAWTRDLENLYSAWVGRLFLIDPGAKAGWRPLHIVLRDPKRNLLWGHLGLAEDDVASEHVVVAGPDCGDTPFFLRAYFAWKMRLPFAVRHCSRGDRRHGTHCDFVPETNLNTTFDTEASAVERFNLWLEEDVGDTVHSGTGRILPEADGSELYPVALSRETLRPGTVFVDPGGHVLVATQWVPGTASRIGMLLAVDAHPDRTVSHKRFSRANFFFDPSLRTGGFKAFRPAVVRYGHVRLATNAELKRLPGYPQPSLEQYELPSAHAFYRKVEALLNPEPLDPLAAYRSHMEAVIELLEERVSAVQVAVDYQQAHEWEIIPMPEGGEIFETTGPWEDYSSPARDLRLLIALDELIAFPRTVMDDPSLFRFGPGQTPATLERTMAQRWRDDAASLAITYIRSDGSPQRLDLAEIVDRLDRFEMAYNPNDCPEIRWGAPKHGAEMTPCLQHAPAEQTTRMQRHRFWHAARHRPSAF